VAEIEAELQKALEDQEVAKQACAKAEHEMESALAEYQAGQAHEPALTPALGGGGSQGPGGEDEKYDDARGAAKGLHQQIEEAQRGHGCKRGVLQELKGAEEATSQATQEPREQPRRFKDHEAGAARSLGRANARAGIAETAGAKAGCAQSPRKGPRH